MSFMKSVELKRPLKDSRLKLCVTQSKWRLTIRRLKQSLENSNTVLIEQYGARTDAELDKARSEFKDAYEGGDTDALLAAQENLSKLHAQNVHRLASAPRPQVSAQAQLKYLNKQVKLLPRLTHERLNGCMRIVGFRLRVMKI